ncbi:MAG: hypothetical protein K0R65_1488 [Crocinitomicaceae bacterium]|jgi:uncharacterized protein|nr:hypothetical protein [Crocinitomicaceae bacterium]
MKAFLLSACFLILQFAVFAQRPGIPEKPNPPRLVNNLSKEFPDFITDSEEAELEAKLEAFSNETSNQIVVVIVDDLNGYEPWDFATEIGYQWQVGQAKEDNGVVILIKPTGGQGDRKTHIAVGRGLEGAIPDLTANDIVNKELIPNFKDGNFYKGIDDACNVIMALAKGEYNHKDYSKKGKGVTGMAIVIAVIAIIFLLIRFGPKGNNRGGRGGGGWTYGAAGFMSGFGAGRSSGGFGGGSSGGFGGFGGGSFGGGGSGGSW